MDCNAHFLVEPLRPASSATPGARTVFQQDWWLHAASGGRIERVELVWDGLRVATLSFVVRDRLGVRSLDMPPYTRTLGPVVTLPASKPTQHALNLQRVARELRAMLPPHDRFHQLLDPGDETPLPFALAGFALSQTFTFRASPGRSRDAMLADLDPATRRLVKSASKSLRLEEHDDAARFLRLAARDRSAAENTHDFAALGRLFTACLDRRQGTFLTAVDGEDRDLAGVFLVWDDRAAHYIVPVRDRDASNGGTNAFLLWSAMHFSLDRGLVFDFDSFGSVGTARFLSSFGLPPVTRSALSFRSPRSRCLDLGRHALSRLRWGPPAPGVAAQDMYGMVNMGNARLSARERDARSASPVAVAGSGAGAGAADRPA